MINIIDQIANETGLDREKIKDALRMLLCSASKQHVKKFLDTDIEKVRCIRLMFESYIRTL